MARHQDARLPADEHEALVNDPTSLRQLVEAALNRFLDAETEHLQAGPHERSDARTGYRNGYRGQPLETRVGTLSLAAPMYREGTFRSEVFDRYQRSEKALVGILDADLAAWRGRPLKVAYPYLIADARHEHVRVNGQVVSQGVLLVKGVREDGLRELPAVEVADTAGGTSGRSRRTQQRTKSRAWCTHEPLHPGHPRRRRTERRSRHLTIGVDVVDQAKVQFWHPPRTLPHAGRTAPRRPRSAG